VIFHIIAQHDHETCPIAKSLEGDTSVKPASKWVEGNDKVKVLGAYAYPVSHRLFGVVESDTFEDVADLFRSHLGLGPVEVLPVTDAIQRRKDMGLWGSD